MLLAGCITALVTPFDERGELDLDAFTDLIDRQLEAGVGGLVVAGSTGEAAMLDEGEYRALLRRAVEAVAGRVPVLAGTGLSGTAATVARTRLAAEEGAVAALVVTPPYVRPTQDGLVRHYEEVARRGGLPVVLYNVPGRTGCDLLPPTVERLSGLEGMAGIKEAVADAERMRALIGLRRPGFAVLGGDDASAGEAMRLGADGLISVISNAAPALTRQYLARGEPAPELAELIALAGVEPNPVPIKAVLAALGVVRNVVRLPLVELTSRHRPAVDALAPRLARAERAARENLS